MRVQAYLNFDGRCEEALEFYKKVLGAEVVVLLRMKDSPEPPPPGTSPPGIENKIMHASFRIGETELMASDCHCAGTTTFQGFSLALSVKDGTAAERAFTALAEGGQVQMPLTRTFFSPSFGVVNDRFGVSWSIMAAAA